MTYSSSSVKLVVGGTVYGAQQTWSTGIRFPTLGLNLEELQDFVNLCIPPTATWMGILKADWNALTNYNFMRAYTYSQLPGKATLVAEAVVTQVVGTASGVIPGEVACVHSLRSDQAGASSRGRMYLPWSASTNLQTNAQIASARLTALSAATAGWITALNLITTSISNMSPAAVLSQTEDRASTYTRVVVDSLLDVQRRRQNKTPATNQVSTDIS